MKKLGTQTVIKKRKAVLFDLDGTLLNTLESIAYCCNRALLDHRFSPFETERYRYFVGDGSAELIRRALVQDGDKELYAFDKVFGTYCGYFEKDCMYHVTPYDGIPEVLKELKASGVRIAVLSNKPHEQAVDVINTVFGKGYFDIVLGQQAGTAKKPSPDGALKIAGEFGADPKECLYVGDTDTDMKTGKAAGMYTVGVLWGFRERRELEENHADRIIAIPGELLTLLSGSGAQ